MKKTKIKVLDDIKEVKSLDNKNYIFSDDEKSYSSKKIKRNKKTNLCINNIKYVKLLHQNI